ncbi:MAG: class I SAM-dependent methyltransferase [Bacteroidetes bacterium]|nr:class I SAM-dependent methyltransferase [Bacteroidota bacterium]
MPRIQPFEEHTDDYEDWFVRNKYAYQSEILAIRKLLPVKGNGIEIGVGTGLFAKALGINTGVEPSPKMSALARKRGIDVIDGIAESLPLKENSYDFALMVTTVCFLDDIKKAFNEVRRILKPHGCFIIGFIDRNSTIGKVYQKFKENNVFYRYAEFYSTREILEYLKTSGFREFEFSQTIFKNLDEIHEVEPVEQGYKRGCFVVIKTLNKK